MPEKKKRAQSLTADMKTAAKSSRAQTPQSMNEDIQTGDYTVSHPLHQALIKKDKEAVRAYIQKESDIEAQDHRGWTALHHAVWHGDREMIEFVIELGAYPQPMTGCGKFPHEIAGQRGHAHLDDLLKMLNDMKKPTDILAEWLDNPNSFIPPRQKRIHRPKP